MAKRLPGEYSKRTKEQNRATIKAQLIADMRSGKMKMTKNEVPFGVAGKAVAKASEKVIRAIAKEAAGKGAKAPFGIYRKPSTSTRPRLRDTDNTPRKTTVRQQVGPKTKSGKFAEPKRKPRTNTQPPLRVKTEKPKVELPDVTKFKGRVIAINKRSANPRIRKRQEAQLNISRREYAAERTRQAKLAKRREGAKADTMTKTDFKIHSKSGKQYTVNVPKSSKEGGAKDIRPSQQTIESRLAAGSEKLPLTARNQSGADRIPPAEWHRYAQLLRESTAKKPNVSPAQIAGGRNRALVPTAERRNAILKAQRDRVIKKAKAKGMTDAQISASINRARAEAAAIARKAAK